MRSRLALLCIAGALVAGCGSSSSSSGGSSGGLGKYPKANEQAFLGSCVREATLKKSKDVAERYCHSALSCIEQRLTLNQFHSLEKNMLLGRRNPAEKTLLDCVKRAQRLLS